MRFASLLLLALLFSLPTTAQSADPDLRLAVWPAAWIDVPGHEPDAYGVYLFRKQFELAAAPDSFPAYVSADNQYELYVNGSLVGRGPSRGDLAHWRYDLLDLAGKLRAGENTIAAKVYNGGAGRQVAQFSMGTGFLLQGSTRSSAVVNTDDSWLGVRDSSYLRPVTITSFRSVDGSIEVPGYYAAGPGEAVDLGRQLRDWELPQFDASDWSPARTAGLAVPRGTLGHVPGAQRRLLASDLPQMEAVPQRFAAVRQAKGTELTDAFLAGGAPAVVPAGTTATVLIDQGFLTNAYPTLTVSGGAGATIVLTYSEAPYRDRRYRGNRNVVDGKTMVGRVDSLYTDGSAGQQFTPVTYRTYRYLQLRITTADDPLTLVDLAATATGYPFEMNARLDSPVTEIDDMLEIGWRTARLCAMDTYMDCPYWEQLQYIGDTRIQAMVSLYNSGDDRLLRNALDLIDWSRQPEGVTMSRYPSYVSQIIAPFSLWYIGILSDYLMYGNDPDFVAGKLMGSRQIIDFFAGYQGADGSLRELPHWSFTDWVNEWKSGIPPMGADGTSALLDLQLLMAYQNARRLEEELGLASYAEQYAEREAQLLATIRAAYYDADRELFADTGEKNSFSQHANSLAILTGVVDSTEAIAIGRQIVGDTSLTSASIYFRYYVHQALVQAGQGDDYLQWLDVWRENIALGLTTWGEDSNVATTRSDCHAWGASPNVEFFRILLGIDSASPGFRTVHIEPHLGDIKKIGGQIPHPAGTLSVAYDTTGGPLATIVLPAGVTGDFIWRGERYPLTAGENQISVE